MSKPRLGGGIWARPLSGSEVAATCNGWTGVTAILADSLLAGAKSPRFDEQLAKTEKHKKPRMVLRTMGQKFSFIMD